MPGTIVHSFAESLSVHRSSEAVSISDSAWTYGQIGDLACAVAKLLVEAGSRPGSRVSILLPNSPEYIAIWYGAQLAGCVTVALNTQEPAPVVSRLLRHSDSSWLFVDETYRGFAEVERSSQELDLRIVGVGSAESQSVTVGSSLWQQVLDSVEIDGDLAIVERSPDDLASIIYTSGTTGNPKGVMLSHRNIRSNIDSILEYLPIESSDRCFNVLPFYYSFGNSVLHSHLAAGASLILQNNIAFPHAVLRRMEEEQATSFYGVPTTFALLFSSDRANGFDTTALRYIAQAGGAMPARQAAQLADDLPGVEIFVMYGQTEATARLTYLEPEWLLRKPGSVGKAIPGVEIRLRRDSEIGHGDCETGEVCARGDNIMMGYLDNPEATAAVIKDGWLRTGDLGYFDEDGFLFLTGRSSDMIKTGANRVSPNEIEDIMGEFSDVSEVCVFGVEDELLGQSIAAAVVVHDSTAVAPQDLRRMCLASLAPYKVPKYIYFTSELPKTGSGKLKRHKVAAEFREMESRE